MALELVGPEETENHAGVPHDDARLPPLREHPVAYVAESLAERTHRDVAPDHVDQPGALRVRNDRGVVGPAGEISQKNGSSNDLSAAWNAAMSRLCRQIDR